MGNRNRRTSYIVESCHDMENLSSAVPGDICQIIDDPGRTFIYRRGEWMDVKAPEATYDRKADIGELIISLTNLISILTVENIRSLSEYKLVVNCNIWSCKRLAKVFPDIQMSVGIDVMEDQYQVLWIFDKNNIYVNEPKAVKLGLASDVIDHILSVDRYLSENFHLQDIPYLKRINDTSGLGGKNNER